MSLGSSCCWDVNLARNLSTCGTWSTWAVSVVLGTLWRALKPTGLLVQAVVQRAGGTGWEQSCSQIPELFLPVSQTKPTVWTTENLFLSALGHTDFRSAASLGLKHEAIFGTRAVLCCCRGLAKKNCIEDKLLKEGRASEGTACISWIWMDQNWRLETMAAWWEEAFSTLLSATRYLQCQPELWVATYKGILWSKLGSGAGAVTQSSVLGLRMCSCNFSAVAPTQESWAAPGLQGPSSFPFLDYVIFPPSQWFRREGLIFPENYSHYVAIRSDHSLWGSSRWTLPAHAPPKRASHHSSLSFFFRLVLIVSQPFQDSEKK